MRRHRAQWSAGAAGPVLATVPDLDCGPAGPRRPAWQEQALCAQSDPDAWFPEKGASSAMAKAICWRCPVQPECLEFVMHPDNADVARFGIWAGLSERDRRRLRSEAA